MAGQMVNPKRIEAKLGELTLALLLTQDALAEKTAECVALRAKLSTLTPPPERVTPSADA